MKLAALLLAASAFALSAIVVSACATIPENAGASMATIASPTLQETASLMVSIGQHGEDASASDVTDFSAQIDEQVAAAPNDPFVLKLAAQSRTTLAGYASGSAQRTALRRQALAEFDKAISFSKFDTASRIVKISGQDTEIDLKDIPDLRKQLAATLQAQ